MNPFPEHIRINGNNFRIREFIQKEHAKEYLNELAVFLEEWYTADDQIKANTSGSTGAPKTISLKKEFIAESALRTLRFFELEAGDRVLHCLPMKFIAGKLMAVRALVGNLDLFITSPGTDFSFLQTEKFRFAAMVPHQVIKILKSEPVTGRWMNNLGQLLIGGSAIPHALELQLQNLPLPCYSSYGMTETATHIALRKINGKEADGYYHCLDKIRVQKNREDCLQLFVPGLAEQPLTTTDTAEVKDEKTFKISGRADNAIVSGGIKYFPELLEKKLEPYIDASFLISSLPHESLGQQLVLAVEGDAEKKRIEKYKDIFLNHLDARERPKQIVFIPGIPRTTTGKPDRKKLFSQINDRHDGDWKTGNVP